MVVLLKAGGDLRLRLKPDVDEYTRRVEAEEGRTLREILTGIGVDPGFVAFAVLGEEVKRLTYVPRNGDVLTLQPPVSGG